MDERRPSGISRRGLLQLGAVAAGAAALANVAGFSAVGGAPRSASASGGSTTDWLHDAKWGVFNQGQMAEYQSPAITTVSAWNTAVNAFDVDAMANQLQRMGAGYLMHAIGQNSGFYCSPNATYDGYVGYATSHCSTRDLVADLYSALHPRGIKLLVYLPGGAPSHDSTAVSALGWTDGPGQRNATFQLKWQNVIQEWSDRWAAKVDGWWFDGVFWPNDMYNFTATPNWDSFAAAARHGNANSVIAFNPSVQNPIQAVAPQEDYTAGETNDAMAVFCNSRWVTAPANATGASNSQVQFQMLTYLGSFWGVGSSPRYTNGQLISATNEVVNGGGVATWDATVSNPSGLIVDNFETALQTMSNQLLGRYIVNDNDPGISYGGGTWFHSTARVHDDYLDDVTATTANGAYAQFTFNGSGVQYWSERDADMGNVDVYIDGVFKQRINCYHTGGKLSRQVLYSVTGLTSGSHTIKVVKIDGTYAIVDAIIVLSTTATVINDTASGIAYTGSWAADTGRNVTDQNQDVHYTMTDGDYFQYTFTGTGIQYLTEMGSDMGTVDVYIDSSFVGTVNCYFSGNKLTQQPVFSKLGLSAGSHTLKVVKTGGTYAVLDGIRVFA